MVDAIRSIEIFVPKSHHRVAVDAIRVDLLKQFRRRGRERFALIACARIPGHHGKQHVNAAALKVADHFPDTFNAARQITQQVVLIAIIDADIRVDGPEQHGIDSAVALRHIFQIAIDRVFSRDRIIKYRSSTIACGCTYALCAHANSSRRYCASV